MMDYKFSKKEVREKVKAINDIYQGYLTKLNKLKKHQANIIDGFIKELEQRRIEEIRKTLK